ncbi:MAG: single-stranded-DNA-specific exonuclease RecJ [Acidobacteria bacterium]|uniref:Single-stranded-DNA-specific exonuclease RecJ n=1 Tax=Candidatus Polarisedimenticola svalbardensis TaxID=2886004 RepID=A0A8J6XTI0_9BACT|nr:single-stranded-DNA-specific exonuclease RecJ [Candidatus Polarisedimenticola svalbardensis]
MHHRDHTDPSPARWVLQDVDPLPVAHLVKNLDLPLPVARVLVVRGYTTAEQVREYWNPSLSTLHPPEAFRDMGLAVDRIRKAAAGQERIRVYGDYDVDGISATTLLVKQLRRMGALVDYRIPSRFTDGYGIGVPAVQQAAEDGVRVLVAVDNGSVAYKAHAAAREAGIDMIVCDHHEAGDHRPDVLAHLNPKAADAAYPFPDLCGAGIAWKLAQGLGATPDELTQYTVLGTIADMVPLRGENRVIARYGLDRLNEAVDRGDPGLAALAGVSGLHGRRIGGGQIGFQLGPRLNAAGRMDDASAGVELLLAREIEDARSIAAGLDASNMERREIQEQMYSTAMAQAEAEVGNGAYGLVLADRNWHSGVVGIVASKVVETFSRPAILIAVDDKGIGKGSGRSVPLFDLHSGLAGIGHLLDRFGGHIMAAGLTVREERIPEFRRLFQELCREALEGADLRPVVTCDAELDLADLNESFVEMVERGAPFGLGNATPQFLVRGARPVGEIRILKDRHLKFQIASPQGRPVDCIGFGMAEEAGLLRRSASSGLDLAARVEINIWQNRRSLQLQLKAVRPAAAEAP